MLVRKLASQKDVWELVVEKWRDWVLAEGRRPEDVGGDGESGLQLLKGELLVSLREQ
jgi:hypothetical protein